jgi:hypothetical protein
MFDSNRNHGRFKNGLRDPGYLALFKAARFRNARSQGGSKLPHSKEKSVDIRSERIQNNVLQERQRRVTKKGDEATMTRRTFQQGYVSNSIRTRNGTAFKIRYRVPASGGKWKHRSETLYGLEGKKAARAVLEERLKMHQKWNRRI